MFMFDDVPEPVWYTSIGKWSSHVTGRDLVGRLGDGPRDVAVDDLQPGVHQRGGPLDLRQRRDQAPLDAQAGDGEVLDGALRLRRPAGVGRHLDLAHGIVLDPVLSHRGTRPRSSALAPADTEAAARATVAQGPPSRIGPR